MIIKPEEYRERIVNQIGDLMDGEDEDKEIHEARKAMARLMSEPDIIRGSNEFKYLKEDKKYPLAYNYSEWIKNIFPQIRSAFAMLRDLYGNKILGLKELYAAFYTATKEKYAYVDDLSVKLLWQNAKNTMEFSYNFDITKQIYNFDKECFEFLMQDTDVKKIPYKILNDNLPVEAFAIDNEFSAGKLNITQTFVLKNFDHEGKKQLGVLFLTEKPDYDYVYVHFPLEDVDNKNYDTDLMEKIEKEIQNVGKDTVEALYKIIPCIVYLCAQNKELRPLKERNGLEKNREKYRAKKGIKTNDVGYYMGSQIKKNKVRYASGGFTGTGSSKRPHIRSGHFHHYWTGEGRTELTVKFVESTFVNGSVDKVVVHKVKK